MVNVSASKALLWIVVILVGIGLCWGLTLDDCDLVNPLSSMSEYQRAQVETQQIAQQNEVDLRQYEALQEAHTQAEVERLQEELRYLQQAHEEDLRRREEETRYLQQVHEQELQKARERDAWELQLLQLAGYTATAVLGFSLLSFSISFSVYVARRRPAPAVTSADVWTPERKRQAIEAARRQEREERKVALRQQKFDLQERLRELYSATVGSNGHEGPDELFSESLSPLRFYD